MLYYSNQIFFYCWPLLNHPQKPFFFFFFFFPQSIIQSAYIQDLSTRQLHLSPHQLSKIPCRVKTTWSGFVCARDRNTIVNSYNYYCNRAAAMSYSSPHFGCSVRDPFCIWWHAWPRLMQVWYTLSQCRNTDLTWEVNFVLVSMGDNVAQLSTNFESVY